MSRGDRAQVMTVRHPDYERAVRASFDRQGLMGRLGARLVRVAPGEVEIEVDFDEGLSQQDGFFHAGVTGAIADSAGGYAAMTLMEADRRVLSVEFKVNLIAPAAGERLVAAAKVVRSGRTLTVCLIDVFVIADSRRVHCATMLQTLMSVEDR